MIWKINNHKVIKQYSISSHTKAEVSDIYYDSHGNLWFSIMHSGFFLIPEGTDQIIDIGTKMGLQKSVVNSYFEDKEGNIWISTMGKGIYCLNHLYIKNYDENDGLISNSVHSIIKDKSGKLLIGTFNGVDIFENNQFSHVNNVANANITEYIYSIKRFNTDYYVTAALNIRKLVNINYHNLMLHFFSRPSICKTLSGLYLVGTIDNQLIIMDKLNNPTEHNLKIFDDSLQMNRIVEIFEDSLHNIWIGTNQGLCKLAAKFSNSYHVINELNWGKTFFPDNPVLNSRIKTIFQDQQNHVWFSGEKGVASYNLTSDSIKTYTNINGFDLSSSTSITSDNKNRIWIGNMKGLFLLDGDSIICLNRQTGLPTNEILSLCFDHEKNMLYVGTSNGLSFLSIDLFDKNVYPPLEVKIISIKAGDSIYTNYNNLVFKPNQNHVYLNFKALCFASPSSVMYKYELNDEWVETDHDYLDLVSLKNGTYHLRIMAKSQNTNWSNPVSLTFQVLPKFIETTRFYLLIMLVLGVISISVMAWWLNRNKIKAQNKLELTERINELKHQALSAMMNPHFIFNSLNSLQYLINCNRNEEATDYVAMMAKLIRKNLDTAGNGFILLSEEIVRLTLYLELEKLRFQDGFSYEIIAGTDVDVNSIMIPNMIVQPFVENTLWHGIINSGSRGMVTVLFSFEEVDIDSILCRSLIIKVTDNGIGIIEARKNKRENHISKGIQIIEERLRLLSAKMKLPQPIMLEDLSTRNNNSHGTEVIISLPPQLYKIISTQPGSSLTV
jgi:ligand-binding sensor domain-containing protein